MTDVKRPYRSPKRRKQAEATRRRILASARALFLSRGYGKTTIRAIAAGAGVAAQTVYAALGSKRGILMGLLDEMAAEADVTRMLAAVEAASGKPQQQLRERIAFNVRFYSAGADLIETARTVSGVEPDLGALWREGEARRHRATSALVAEWARAGVLAPGLPAVQAVDVMWSLSGPDLFRLFVVERGWGRDRYETWLSGTLERLLFAEA